MSSNGNGWHDGELNRRSVLRGLGAAAAGSAFAGASTGSVAAAPGEDAVLQYYHTSWNDLRADLGRVADAGFAAIQVPPPQESRLSRWDQGEEHPEYGSDYPYHPPLGYQPVNRDSFDSEFGTESEFRSMIDEAHNQGLRVIVDAVCNHMAADTSFDQFPNFGYDDFHHEGGIEKWMYEYDPNDDRCYDENGWECDPWMIENGDLSGLPDLDQSRDHVRNVLERYVGKIADCGADGIRWDAAKHMPESLFSNHMNQWADWHGLYKVGEVLHGANGYLDQYARTGMDVTDYSLYYALEHAFHGGGDLRDLDGAGYVDWNPRRSMTFVANHDSAPPEHADLARAFILTYEGYPRVYNYLVDLDDEALRNLLWIRNNLLGGQAKTRYVDQDYIIFEREANALVCINKSGEWRGEWVETSWSSRHLDEHTGATDGTDVNSDGWTEPWAPPKGWAIYAP